MILIVFILKVGFQASGELVIEAHASETGQSQTHRIPKLNHVISGGRERLRDVKKSESHDHNLTFQSWPSVRVPNGNLGETPVCDAQNVLRPPWLDTSGRGTRGRGTPQKRLWLGSSEGTCVGRVNQCLSGNETPHRRHYCRHPRRMVTLSLVVAHRTFYRRRWQNLQPSH